MMMAVDDISVVAVSSSISLQSFDAVGWMTVRAFIL